MTAKIKTDLIIFRESYPDSDHVFNQIRDDIPKLINKRLRELLLFLPPDPNPNATLLVTIRYIEENKE